MSDWITPPYYHKPSAVYVDCGPFFGRQPTAETMMQVLAYEILSWPQGFMFGADGGGPDAPQKLSDQIVAYAKDLANPDRPQSKITAAGFDPLERGAFYVNLVLDTLRKIQASAFNWQDAGSVYDAWIARTQ